MEDKVGGQFRIEQPDAESHHYGDEGGPNRRSHKNLLE